LRRGARTTNSASTHGGARGFVGKEKGVSVYLVADFLLPELSAF
jgi:hypothetical protein